MSTEDTLRQLGGRILDEFKVAYREGWEHFSDDEKKLVAAVAQDVALLSVRAAAGENVADAKLQTDAQVANLRAAVATSVSDALWGVAARIFRLALNALL